MRFADVENIWTADLNALSNADRGRVYFERAKQVVAEALADHTLRKRAVAGKQFRRDYLEAVMNWRRVEPHVST